MRSLSRRSLLPGLVVLALAVLPGGVVHAQGKKADTKDVSFTTYDGVELKGTLYPNAGGKRDAVVLLLHDFDHVKGGSSQKDNLPDLARSLQADGYVVLLFDFRGFGDSKTVNKDRFWTIRHNTMLKGAAKRSETIDQKNFPKAYYAYLVNDIAAAKAYLDRLNDQKVCNTSSLLIVGAGQGATLGAMWMANECRRKKDKNSGKGVIGLPMLDDPESRDLAGAIWLTIRPALEGRRLPVSNWLREVGRTNKVPMAFYFGKNDTRSGEFARTMVNMLKSGKTKLDNTGVKVIEGTGLGGTKLLEPVLGTEKAMKTYFSRVMEARGNKEWRKRDVTDRAFYYVINRRMILNKRAGDEAPPVDVGQLTLGGG